MQIKIKPSPGLKLRDPVSKQYIPEDGIMVSDTDTHWHRRILRGDVVIVPEVVVTEIQIPDSPESAAQGEEKP